MTTASGDNVYNFAGLSAGPYTNANLTFLLDTAVINDGNTNPSVLQSAWSSSSRIICIDTGHTFTGGTGVKSVIEKNSPSTGGGQCGPGLYDTSGNGYELKIVYNEFRVFRVVAGVQTTAISEQLILTTAESDVFGIECDADNIFTFTHNGIDIPFEAVQDSTYPVTTLRPGHFSDRNDTGAGYQAGVRSFASSKLGGSGEVFATPSGVSVPTAVGTVVARGSATIAVTGVAVATAVGTVQVAGGNVSTSPSGVATGTGVGKVIPYVGTTSTVVITSVATGSGYLGSQMTSGSIVVGSIIKFPTAASLGLAGDQVNYIDVDGGIYTDYDGTQVISVHNPTTGVTEQVYIINGTVASGTATPSGVSTPTAVGTVVAFGNQTARPAGVSVATAVGVVVASAPNAVPQAFSFIDVTNAQLIKAYTSSPITVLGINTGSPITVTGGSYSINGGGYVTGAGTVYVNDVVRVRNTSSGSTNTAVNTTLTIGGVSDTFTITTGSGVVPPASNDRSPASALVARKLTAI